MQQLFATPNRTKNMELDIKITNCWKNIQKRDKVAFFSAFIISALCYMYAYTNNLFYLDGGTLKEEFLYFYNGRFFCFFLVPFLSGGYALPWLCGVLAAVFMGFASVIATRCLRLNSPLLITLTAAVLIVNPVYGFIHIYVSTVYVYAFACFTALLSAYFADKGGWENTIWAVLTLIVSLSCYQAYVCVALAVMVITIIGRYQSKNVKVIKCVKKGLHYIGIAAVAMILYYALWKGIMFVTKTPDLNYRGYDNIAGNIFSDLPRNLFSAAGGAIFVWLVSFSFSTFTPEKIVNLVLVLLSIALAYVVAAKKHERDKVMAVLFITLCFMMLAVASSFIFVLNPAAQVIRMCCGSVAPFLLLIQSISNLSQLPQTTKPKRRKTVVGLAVTLLVASTLFAVVSVNSFFLKITTTCNNALSVSTRILDRIEQIDGVTKDTEIVFVQDQSEKIYNNTDWASRLSGTVDSAVSAEMLPRYIQQELSTCVNARYDWNDEYLNNEAIKGLSCFPRKDCYTWMDEVLVFKLPVLQYESRASTLLAE